MRNHLPGTEGHVFETLRNRIRGNRGKVRKEGADYLVYALIDLSVDGYFSLLESLIESLVETEDSILEAQDVASLQELHVRKRELIGLQKNIWSMREVVAYLERGDSMLITRSTNIYFRDVQDHIMQITDTIEGLRDVVTGLLELYLSSSSTKTNEVMKVLTIIATIFIPLTFVAGVYGMSFQHMPEPTAKLGYPLVLLVMGAIGFGMIVFFKRKKWQ